MNTTHEPALDEFTLAYIIAALWTYDENAPSGEFSTSGRFEILFPQIDRESLLKMIADCARFQKENSETLKAFQPKDSQNGHDFWLTRNHHGTGFWDRPQMADSKFEELGNALTKSAYAFGECDLYEGDDKKIYIQ